MRRFGVVAVGIALVVVSACTGSDDGDETDGAGARAAGCQCLILGRDFWSFDALLKEFQSLRG